ncbi:YktB family protein [Chryseomicrobium imtechense]
MSYWTKKDFNVFKKEGLEARMEGLDTHIRPKFHELGAHFSDELAAKLGHEMFPHVAKHARRTVNPPKDSWVAFAPYKRGYKALPHFQIGLWESHLFVILAVIYEAPTKSAIADRLGKKTSLITSLPSDFLIAGDHMKPDAEPITKSTTSHYLTRLRTIKKGELVIGRHLNVDETAALSKKEFYQFVDETFEELLPLYREMTSLN